MITIISAVLVFLLLITVHELGHFIAAKSVGIKVLEFAVGMGPALFKRQRGETLYSVRLLPIGGFCKMEGEDEDSEDERSFGNKKIWQRFIVLASGALMNIITGFIIFVIMLSFIARIQTPVVNEILPDSPAQQAGLMTGDRIIRLNGTKINIGEDFDFEMSRYTGGQISVDFVREGKKHSVALTPMMEESGRYIIGFTRTIQNLNVFSTIRTAYYSTLFFSKYVLVSFMDLIMGRVSFGALSGPVGIVNQIGVVAKTGLLDLAYLTALITINLGVFNLLPIPALDGGRILFLLVEALRRKKVPAEKEGFVHFIGFALLILLMIFATVNDIGKI